MKNFPLKDENGKEWWVSRSVAVVGCVFAVINGKMCVLANQRGKGAADFQGMWNMPCGYVDFNETTREAVSREVFEETGIKVSPNQFTFYNFSDNPKDNRQNITFEFVAIVKGNQPKDISVGVNTEERGGEKNEVAAISWIPVEDIDKCEWAFNHNKIIKQMFDWSVINLNLQWKI